MEEKSIIRCGARTRRQKLCEKHPVKGKNRCRMHGGAEGSGAPIGNANAFKHGRYSAETLRRRQEITEFCRDFKRLKAEMGI